MAQVSKYRYLLNQYPETVQKEQFRIICHKIGRAYRIPKAHILRYLKITCSTFAE